MQRGGRRGEGRARRQLWSWGTGCTRPHRLHKAAEVAQGSRGCPGMWSSGGHCWEACCEEPLAGLERTQPWQQP
eukprot:356736-Chlamydomonas_euryale.AAC.4